MKIPQKLSEFKNKKSLLLVSGKQEMVIYKIIDDEIIKESHFKIPNPSYSDNEGHFKVRSQGKVIRSGSVREVDDREIIVKFKNELIKNLKKIKKDFDQVLISFPAKTKNEILDVLPQPIKEKLVKTIIGNYCSFTPIDILSKFLDKKKNSKKIIKDPEARKILKKSNLARKVIKGKVD